MPKKILIAEDSVEIGTRLAALLAELDEVEIVGPAINGTEALQLFKNFAPHVAVLDLQMPGLNGLEVLVAIRSQNRPCLIIILTNHDNQEFRCKCLEAGADFFLKKSTEFERLRDIIQSSTEGQP